MREKKMGTIDAFFEPLIQCVDETHNIAQKKEYSETSWSLMKVRSTAMSLDKWLVRFLFLQLIASRVLAGTIMESVEKSKYSYDLFGAMVKLVKFCHGMEIKTVGIAGNVPDHVIDSLMSEEQFSVILIDDTTKFSDRETMPRIFRSKLQLFVVAAHSTLKLREFLINIMNSRWWNHMAIFYIIDHSVGENNCANAYAYLWAAWSINILEATFICIHRTQKIMLYSFNPYTSDAPEPWKMEKTYNGTNNHPWSLLVRKYSKDGDTCVNMFFDKTKDLGGYEIVATVHKSSMVRILPNKTGIQALDDTENTFLSDLFNSWNASIKLLVHETNETIGSVNDEGITDGILAEISSGKSDIGLISKFLWRGDILTWTYPFYYSGISVMTQYSGNESQLKKILSLFDTPSKIGFSVVCLLTFIFFKYFLHQTRDIAALNTLRLICNSCLPKLPFETSSRIYIGVIFLSVITIQGIYQGQLSSLLAKRVPLSNINSMEDLATSPHKIYGANNVNNYLNSQELQSRFVAIECPNCTDHVLEDSKAACLRFRNDLIDDAARLKLHVSKNYLVQLPAGWMIREDWPLERKMNKIIQNLVEADIIRNSYEKPLEKSLHQLRANEVENRDRTSKILHRKDLEFAFVILGIGLGLSTMVFVIEVLIEQGAYAKIAKTIRSCRLRSG